LIQRCGRGAEIMLAGFYSERINFAFPHAFMREMKFRIAAEWGADDMTAINALIDEGILSLDGLVTHRAKAVDAKKAYVQAFEDPTCYKMVLDWEAVN